MDDTMLWPHHFCRCARAESPLPREGAGLVRACGHIERSAQLVHYPYGRRVGEMAQEVGDVMATLAALCLGRRYSYVKGYGKFEDLPYAQK